MFNYLERQTSQNGIIFLQETHTTEREKLYGLINLAATPNGNSDARGILIAFREAMKYKIVSKHIDNDGRYIILNV